MLRFMSQSCDCCHARWLGLDDQENEAELGNSMDLGIKGKNAIVCASSRGLGRGCAMALAEAGCNLVVNGRNPETLQATAREIRERFGVSVAEVAADVSTQDGQK